MKNDKLIQKNEKNIIRKKILTLRKSMLEEDVKRKSGAIIDKLIGLDAWEKSNIIMSYVNFEKEVITIDFIRKSLLKGKRMVVPLVATNNGNSCSEKIKKRIIPCEIKDLDKELEKGNFGILEPKKEYIRDICVKEIDLIIVPGIAFDTNKNRLGFGAGYYDEFLQHIPKKCLTIGIAFECQMVEKVPVESHDIPLDIIITEKRVIK